MAYLPEDCVATENESITPKSLRPDLVIIVDVGANISAKSRPADTNPLVVEVALNPTAEAPVVLRTVLSTAMLSAETSIPSPSPAFIVTALDDPPPVKPVPAFTVLIPASAEVAKISTKSLPPDNITLEAERFCTAIEASLSVSSSTLKALSTILSLVPPISIVSPLINKSFHLFFSAT